MGVILYAMVAGYTPFTNDDNIASAEDNRTALLEMIRTGKHKPYPDSLPADVLALMRSILVVDPTRRTTLAQMRMNSWLKLESMVRIPQRIDPRIRGVSTQENDCDMGVFRYLNIALTVIIAAPTICICFGSLCCVLCGAVFTFSTGTALF
jgi:serine/threonine protein kinase